MTGIALENGTQIKKNRLMVIRSFGTQDLCELYSDYVAIQISEKNKNQIDNSDKGV